jgi:hypothetical protein
VLIHRTLKGAVVIPQRVTFEVLDKRRVYVAGIASVPEAPPIRGPTR